jgi:hypothetical protein
MSLERLKEFEETETAKQWSSARRLTPHLRDFFLAVEPEAVIVGKTPEQLRECRKLVEELIARNRGDEHFTAVLHRHRRLIRQKLRPLSG